MLDTIIGSKVSMSQAFIDGVRFPVTHIMAGPCVVTQIKANTVQLGFGTRRSKNTSKPLQGHLKNSLPKAIKTDETKIFPRHLREVTTQNPQEFKVGDKVSLTDIFGVGDLVSVTGVSKGKGFAGVVKRHHFAGGPKTHGQSDRHRAPGSIGQRTTPGRVYKGKRMAGRMGSDTVTVRNLKVLEINPESGTMAVSGPVPGTLGRPLLIKRVLQAPKE